VRSTVRKHGTAATRIVCSDGVSRVRQHHAGLQTGLEVVAGRAGDPLAGNERRDVRLNGGRGFAGSRGGENEVMRGDAVEVVIDAGGTSRRYEIVASRAGRRVEVTYGRGVVEVAEVTRGGTPVRTARFMTARILALIEHPADSRRSTADEADTSS
jgi:hypothetical protein